MSVGEMGHQSTMSMNALSYPVLSDSVGKVASHLARQGVRGTRSHDVDGVVDGPYAVSGSVVLNPTAAEFTALAVYMFGTAGLLTEVLPTFAQISERGPDVWTFPTQKVNQATLRGTAGGLLELTLDIEGLTGTVTGSAPTEPVSARPLVMSDCAFTLVGSARNVESFELVINHALVVDRWMNGLTRVDLPEGDRIVTLNCNVDHNATNADLYDQALAGTTGSLVITDGSTTHTMTFAKLQVPEETPPIPGKGLIMLPLPMTARKDGDTKELVLVTT